MQILIINMKPENQRKKQRNFQVIIRKNKIKKVLLLKIKRLYLNSNRNKLIINVNKNRNKKKVR